MLVKLMVFPLKVCCITQFHDKEPGVPVRLTLITTDMVHKDKILFYKEWWLKDISEDEMFDEVDYFIGLLRKECPSAYIMHVEGTAQLTWSPEKKGYLTSYVTKADMLKLIKENPEKFA
jgi:hypothetical protein